MPSLRSILSASPYVETAVRKVYWGSPVLPTIVTRLDARREKRAKERGDKPPSADIDDIVAQLREWGVGEGDLLLVHSGYRGIRAGKRSPDAILDKLLELVGPQGTLCMPSIPYWPEAPQLYDRMVSDYKDIVLDYDPAETPAWTGAVPAAMIKRPDAVRSLHPLNTMSAIGPLAEAMVAHDLDGDRPFPNGPQSSWNFCNEHDAWIVAMGADMAHSLTMIHLAEDLMGEDWPVEGWYRDRRFRVRIDGEWHDKVVRERHPKWATHYGERTLSRDLIAAGITRRAIIDGVNVELLRSSEMIDYLNRRNRTLYPYFMIPQRLRKPDPRDPVARRLQHRRAIAGRALVQTDAGLLIEHRGRLTLVDPEDGARTELGSLPPVGLRERVGAQLRIAERVLRSDAQCGVALDDDRYLVGTKRGVYLVDAQASTVELEHPVPGRRGPLQLGRCEGIDGFVDRILFGEYGSNADKSPMSVWGRPLAGGGWAPLFTFPAGEVNHIHAVIADPHRHCVWILTGDYGPAAGLWRADADFETVVPVARGDQRYRACRVFPRADGLLYATDSHLRPNSIRLLEPGPDGTWRDRALAPTIGSCIHAAEIGGQYVFTTSVEPGRPTGNRWLDAVDPRRGPGISVGACQVIIGTPEQGFSVELEWPTDALPKRLFGFSTISLPTVHGDPTTVALTGAGVIGHDGITEVYSLAPARP